jgi:hypothetical protein
MPNIRQSITLSNSIPPAPPGRRNVEWQADSSNPDHPFFSASVPNPEPAPPVTTTTSLSEVPAGLLDGINNVFTLSQTPDTGSLQIFVNGVEWYLGIHFTVEDRTITFALAPKTTDWLRATYTYTVTG